MSSRGKSKFRSKIHSKINQTKSTKLSAPSSGLSSKAYGPGTTLKGAASSDLSASPFDKSNRRYIPEAVISKFAFNNPTHVEMVRRLDLAIPNDEMERIKSQARIFSDGLVMLSGEEGEDLGKGVGPFNLATAFGRVTAYNDTRRTRQEIVDWINRARFITEEEQ